MVNIFTPSGSSCLRFARLPYFAPAVLLFLSGCAPANKTGYFPQQTFATTVNDTLTDALDFYQVTEKEDSSAGIREPAFAVRDVEEPDPRLRRLANTALSPTPAAGSPPAQSRPVRGAPAGRAAGAPAPGPQNPAPVTPPIPTADATRLQHSREAGILDRLATGMIAFDIPRRMKVGETYNVFVSITGSRNQDIAVQGMEEDRVQTDTLKVSTKMKVTLVDPSGGKNFEIRPPESEVQLVEKASNTQWEWAVSPKKSGQSTLKLKATIVLQLGSSEVTKNYTVYQTTVQVKASPLNSVLGFVGNNLDWAWTVLMVPLLNFVWRRLRGRKKEEHGQDNDAPGKGGSSLPG